MTSQKSSETHETGFLRLKKNMEKKDHEIKQLKKQRTDFAMRIADLERELEAARKGLAAVSDLINESHGVTGLHLNGDVAPWQDLQTGGTFEEWLVDFDEEIKAMNMKTTQEPSNGHD